MLTAESGLRFGFVRLYRLRHRDERPDRGGRLLVLLGFFHFLVAALLTFGHGISPRGAGTAYVR